MSWPSHKRVKTDFKTDDWQFFLADLKTNLRRELEPDANTIEKQRFAEQQRAQEEVARQQQRQLLLQVQLQQQQQQELLQQQHRQQQIQHQLHLQLQQQQQQSFQQFPPPLFVNSPRMAVPTASIRSSLSTFDACRGSSIGAATSCDNDSFGVLPLPPRRTHEFGSAACDSNSAVASREKSPSPVGARTAAPRPQQGSSSYGTFIPPSAPAAPAVLPFATLLGSPRSDTPDHSAAVGRSVPSLRPVSSRASLNDDMGTSFNASRSSSRNRRRAPIALGPDSNHACRAAASDEEMPEIASLSGSPRVAPPPPAHYR